MGLKDFAEGGAASITAACTTHPLDLLKVRMQLHGELPPPRLRAHHLLSFAGHSPPAPPARPGPITLFAHILRSEGPTGLYSGVSASILRQAVYSTTTMGLYQTLKAHWGAHDHNHLPLHKKILAGLISGAIGASVGNPADVAMVRMQADGRLPFHMRRNYKNALDAIARICREEGVLSLWRGCGLTIKRAMVVSASQLATYDQAKEAIEKRFGDGPGTHMAAGVVAGVVAAAASTPVDVVKTRIMNMRTDRGRRPVYASALDCAVKTVRTEGVMALYKGFVATVSRQGPFTVVMFVTLEQVRKVLKDD